MSHKFIRYAGQLYRRADFEPENLDGSSSVWQNRETPQDDAVAGYVVSATSSTIFEDPESEYGFGEERADDFYLEPTEVMALESVVAELPRTVEWNTHYEGSNTPLFQTDTKETTEHFEKGRYKVQDWFVEHTNKERLTTAEIEQLKVILGNRALGTPPTLL